MLVNNHRPKVAARVLGLVDDIKRWQLWKVCGDERHSKGTQTSSRRLFISRSRSANEEVGPGIECSVMLNSESRRAQLCVFVSGDVCVEACRRENI